MTGAEEKLIELENCIRRFNKADEIVFMLLTNNEHGTITPDDMKKVKEIVGELNDNYLSCLYCKFFQEGRMSAVYPQIRRKDYTAFIQRLGTLLNELTVATNEADIALRESLGLAATTGIWGGRGWRPSGQL